MTYKVTKKNIIKAIVAGKRFDGRGLLDNREIEIKFGVSNKAEGSVMVKMGKTEVACGIKMGVSTPYTDHEAEGTMMTSLELLPLSSPNFEYGQPTIESVETARIIDRGIRESGFIDFKKLCIKEGEKVWSIFIDIATINDDGNLIDAGSLAALLALLTARKPVYDAEKDKIEFGEFSDEKLPLNVAKMPITMTFFKIDDSLIVDPTRDEEDACEARLTIEVSKPGKEEIINAMQKGGEEALGVEEVEKIVGEGTKMFKKLNSLIETEVEKFEKEEKKKTKK
jgi:exosome complex component RRP42